MLRDLPEQTGFPLTATWPLAPGEVIPVVVPVVPVDRKQSMNVTFRNGVRVPKPTPAVKPTPSSDVPVTPPPTP